MQGSRNMISHKLVKYLQFLLVQLANSEILFVEFQAATVIQKMNLHVIGPCFVETSCIE